MQVGPMYLKDRVVMTIAEEESMRGCCVVYCHVCDSGVWATSSSSLFYLFLLYLYVCMYVYTCILKGGELLHLFTTH